MADVVVLGAGIAGHTAALHLSRKLKKPHTITVVSPNSQWNWIPSNIWVGVGKMSKAEVVFPLADIYAKRIRFRQAKAVAIRPQGDAEGTRGAVDIVYTSKDRSGQEERIRYDYLINATGPQLKFGMTEGLGPEIGHTVSVCTADHATEAAGRLDQVIATLKAGTPQTLVIGMGHGTCTCEGAAFEYTFNVDHELRAAGVRDLATIVYLTNEAELGDFGVGGMTFEDKGQHVTSEMWTSSLFQERDIKAILGAHVEKVEAGLVHYETLDGEHHTLAFDFGMLLPPFGGAPLAAYDKDGGEITGEVFAPSGFMKVDADYTPKPFEEWKASDWPQTYQCVGYDNVFAAGIAFAPPHQISRPRKTANGTVVAPSPPRTGMPSGVIGKTVAMSIVDRIKGKSVPARNASMAGMPAACVASAGAGMRDGSAASMTMSPIVPDYTKYPTGRSLAETKGEIGLSGHWVKLMLHYLFIYKAKGHLGWQFIPE